MHHISVFRNCYSVTPTHHCHFLSFLVSLFFSFLFSCLLPILKLGSILGGISLKKKKSYRIGSKVRWVHVLNDDSLLTGLLWLHLRWWWSSLEIAFWGCTSGPRLNKSSCNEKSLSSDALNFVSSNLYQLQRIRHKMVVVQDNPLEEAQMGVLWA